MTEAASPPPLASPCTCFQVRRAARVITQMYDAALAPLGLRITQFSVLAHLMQRPYPLTELAEALVMDRTTLTRTLKPLEQAGWISTIGLPTDRRVKQADITAAGKALYQQGYPLWKQVQHTVRDRVGREQTKSLHQQLTMLVQALTP